MKLIPEFLLFFLPLSDSACPCLGAQSHFLINFSSIKKAENNADNAQNVLNIAVTGSAPNDANAAQTEELFSRIAQKLNTPFVAKPRFGSQGRGIQLIETKKDFALFCSLYCPKPKRRIDFSAVHKMRQRL